MYTIYFIQIEYIPSIFECQVIESSADEPPLPFESNRLYWMHEKILLYAAVIPFILCIALILGSWWALMPGVIIAALFVIRTALEDRMLQEELPDYKAYAQRVRYRLLPGVW